MNREAASALREKRERDRLRRQRRKAMVYVIAAAVLLGLLIVLGAAKVSGRESAVERAEEARVMQIREERLAAETTPVPELKPASEETTIHEATPDWGELMVRAVLAGDAAAGADCEERGGLGYTYEDLYLLAKLIEQEAGIDWPDMPIIALANVVLNRVASPLFPDTIREVLYQEGPGDTVQYAPVHTGYWETAEPTERYVRLAQRALNGEEVIGEEVIYQALFPQGRVTVMTWYDEYLNTTTYFCE